MTLLITLASRSAIHLGSDYRLSDQGIIKETRNGAKQLTVSAVRWVAQISFTGIARDGQGYDTCSWLSDVARSASSDLLPGEFIKALALRGSSELKRVEKYDNRLTIIVGIVAIGICRLFRISNWEIRSYDAH